MNRATLDKLISSTAVIVTIVLFAAGAGLLYASSFIHSQVHEQLAEQKITFPEANSAAINALPDADREAVNQYAGQQLLTGAQAEVFANHYINAHLAKTGGGKTYSELSNISRANPNDAAAAKQVETMFRGETLRGLLLNAYAFDTMATVAKIGGYVAIVAGLILGFLAVLGFGHASKATKSTSKKRSRK